MVWRPLGPLVLGPDFPYPLGSCALCPVRAPRLLFFPVGTERASEEIIIIIILPLVLLFLLFEKLGIDGARELR